MSSKRRNTSGSRRDEDGSKRRRMTTTGSSTNNVAPAIRQKNRLDPILLARGMTARTVGPRLLSLSQEEIERDLRHMEAYSNACIAYSQQLFMFANRNLGQSGHYAAAAAAAGGGRGGALLLSTPSTIAMPVRIDPEEEKLMSLLRKKISLSEREREYLETEYVALRASYVYESHALENTRKTVDGQLKFLQTLVQRRGKVVALQRSRCAIAREILSALVKRNELLQRPTDNTTTGTTHHGLLQGGGDEKDDILQVWNDIESQLVEAKRACQSLEAPKHLRVKGSTNASSSSSSKDRRPIIEWDARTMPRTPNDLPIYLSQLSYVPDKGAAFGCGGIFGSKKSSMCWLQSNLPRSMQKEPMEQLAVKALLEESLFLESELQKERNANNSLQSNIAHCRRQNDEMCALMTMLRSETDAVLNRHNVLLDTPEARAVAKDIYSSQHHLDYNNNNNNERYYDSVGGDLSLSHANEAHEDDNNKNNNNQHDGDDEPDSALSLMMTAAAAAGGGASSSSSTRTSTIRHQEEVAEDEDLDHDGDDEGDDDEDDVKEEEGRDEVFDDV